jgi:hypothetical protein
MSTQSNPATVAHQAHAEGSGALGRAPGVLARWQGRRAERKRARLISARNRRVLAKWLRRTANHAIDPDPIRRRYDVLLHYRAAAVRTDLLEIAAMLERANDPNPDCVTALHDLLAHTGHSPLYDPKISFSELEAALDCIRSGLERSHTASEPAAAHDAAPN